MTEIEAWAELARQWRKPCKLYGDVWGVRLSYPNDTRTHNFSGLCTTVRRLIMLQLITRALAIRMTRKLEYAISKNKLFPYAWPRTRAGAKERVQYCLNQVERLKKKRRKKKCPSR